MSKYDRVRQNISVIESWLKQPVLTPPPINELYDALELLKEQEEQRPTKQASALMADHHYYACPKCGCMVDYLVWKCYACNQKLNWD